MGLVIVERAKTIAYNRASSGQTSAESLILPSYTKKVEAKTDARKLAQIGQNLLEKDMPSFAAVNFKQATTLDPGYRDAAYGWAYSVALANHGNLNEENLREINVALDKVEAVDPHYVSGLKLRREIALVEGKNDLAHAVMQRLEMISQSQSNH